MSGQQPVRTSDDDNRVIKFRPRDVSERQRPKPALMETTRETPKTQTAVRQDAPNPPLKFTPRPRPPGRIAAVSDQPGPRPAADDRRRTATNLAALVFTLCLTALAVWLATTIADMRQTQDCLLVGRRDCSRIPLPPITTVHQDQS
jgi:hypothetical protein